MKSKQNAILIFAGLAGFTIFAFQNCSSSFRTLVSGKPVQASDVSDMLRSSQKELSATKKNQRSISSVSNEPTEIRPKSDSESDLESEDNVLDKNVRYRDGKPAQNR